jgi:ribonuclease P protein component
MLPKKNRIHTRFEFGKVKKFGDSYRYKYFYLYALPLDRLQRISKGRWNIGGQTQAGFLMSIKLHKNAVVRNRVKRLFRESVRQNFGKLSTGWWLVFHPRFICVGTPYEKINAEVATILQKLSFAGKVWAKNLPV